MAKIQPDSQQQDSNPEYLPSLRDLHTGRITVGEYMRQMRLRNEHLAVAANVVDPSDLRADIETNAPIVETSEQRQLREWLHRPFVDGLETSAERERFRQWLQSQEQMVYWDLMVGPRPLVDPMTSVEREQQSRAAREERVQQSRAAMEEQRILLEQDRRAQEERRAIMGGVLDNLISNRLPQRDLARSTNNDDDDDVVRDVTDEEALATLLQAAASGELSVQDLQAYTGLNIEDEMREMILETQREAAREEINPENAIESLVAGNAVRVYAEMLSTPERREKIKALLEDLGVDLKSSELDNVMTDLAIGDRATPELQEAFEVPEPEVSRRRVRSEDAISLMDY
jgi:hypothetical protein